MRFKAALIFSSLALAFVFVTLLGGETAKVYAATDSDGDALPDSWENGVTPDGLDLKALGAREGRKDVFVEMDFSSPALRNNIACDRLDALVDAFRKAPVSNPNGSTGITLHLDAGKTCPSRSYNLGGSNGFTASQPCSPTGEPFGPNGAKMAMKRWPVFHHAAVVHRLCSAYGINYGSRFAIGADAAFTLVFMHEIGHGFGMDHDPAPNRISNMSGPIYYQASASSGPQEVVDYQRWALPAVNEAHMDEFVGLGGPPQVNKYWAFWSCPAELGGFIKGGWHARNGPLNWNCSEDALFMDTFQHGIQALDISGDGQITRLKATPNEWRRLNFAAGGQIGTPLPAQAASDTLVID
ncbi:MAG: reprolysin-like metallopeptidase [Dehalococcoidia bacterium]